MRVPRMDLRWRRALRAGSRPFYGRATHNHTAGVGAAGSRWVVQGSNGAPVGQAVLRLLAGAGGKSGHWLRLFPPPAAPTAFSVDGCVRLVNAIVPLPM